jgi:hypothetical protein
MTGGVMLQRTIVLILGLHASLLPAQRTITLPPVSTPLKADVQLTRRVILSDAASPVKNAGLRLAAIDSRGRYYLTAMEEARFLVFDSTGKFLQSVGRRGKGPGEFVNPFEMFVAKGDTIFISEWARGISVFSPDYKYIRQVQTPPGDHMIEPIRLRSGEYAYIVNERGYPEVNWHHRLAFADAKGKVLTKLEIGPVRTKENYDEGGRSRSLAENPDGTIWSAVMRRYVIDRWDRSGKRLEVITRQLDGPAVKDLLVLPFNEPFLYDLKLDGDGRLWVVMSLRNGKTHRATVRTEQGMREMNIDEHDSIVEVIDPKRGTLVASTRISGGWLTFVRPDVACRPIEQENGSMALEVLDVKLTTVRKR